MGYGWGVKTIDERIIAILRQGELKDNFYFLPKVVLDRKTYLEINEVLVNAGGKWDKKSKAHIFQKDPSEALSLAIETGETINKKKELQFFETPNGIARQITELADMKDGMTVLEPSAGHGAILDEIDKALDIRVICIEIDEEKCIILREKGYEVECGNFLEFSPFAKDMNYCIGGFDRVVMNPPFTKGQDATHILHAYDEMLNDGGCLVSVVSSSVTFNQQKKYQRVRELVEQNGQIINLPSSSFKESGTNVETVLVCITKPITK
ncbi:MAG TPA: class I SAM-dependent methyltransferase [bacterium]|nr:class I SAM-dependent methyltransferase [bacterium]